MRYCPNERCPHRVRTGRAAEFEDWAESCSDCSAALDLAPPSQEAAGIDWVLLDRFTHPEQATLARSKLESEGVPVSLADQNINEIDWMIAPAVGWVRLFVAREDLERARSILAEDSSAALDALVAAQPESFAGSEPAATRSTGPQRAPSAGPSRVRMVGWLMVAAALAVWAILRAGTAP